MSVYTNLSREYQRHTAMSVENVSTEDRNNVCCTPAAATVETTVVVVLVEPMHQLNCSGC